MPDMLIKNVLLKLFLFLAVVLFSSHAYSQEKQLRLPDAVIKVMLEQNYKINDKIVVKGLQNQDSALHFKASISDNGWLRASKIGNEWLGLARFDASLYEVVSKGEDLQLVPINTSVHDMNCGLHKNHKSPITNLLSELDSQPQTFPQINAQTLYHDAKQLKAVCDNSIEGVCSFAEVEFVFDQLYQSRFDSEQLSERTNALINMVEGFYENDFSIRFNTITTEFLSSVVFDSTTDASSLLSDIRTKKRDGGLDFVKNTRSLLHFVTGRDFDGGTAGVAYVGVLCDSRGFSSGTSNLIPASGGTPNLSITALIIAHEVGHNFGSGHDGDGNDCPSSGFIMGPSVSRSATNFSSCSIEQMTQEYNGLSNLLACFDLPIELAIASDIANPTEVTIAEEVNLDFTVTLEIPTNSSLGQYSLAAFMPSGTGRFNSASLAGVACTISASADSFSCQLNNPTASSNVDIQVTPLTTDFEIRQEISIANDNFIDANLSNNALTSEFTVNEKQPPNAVNNLTASEANNVVTLNWSDNSNDETGFRVERSVNSGNFSQLANVAENITTLTDSNVSAGNTYAYRIVAFNAGGDASASNQVSVTLTAPPPAPPSNDAGNSGGGGAMHWWLLILLTTFKFVHRVKGPKS